MVNWGWPSAVEELVETQRLVAGAAQEVEPWEPALDQEGLWVGGCFLAYARGQAGPGGSGDRAWAAAVVWPRAPGARKDLEGRTPDRALAGSGPGVPRQAGDIAEQVVVGGTVPAGYQAGLLALREGPLLEAAVTSLQRRIAVLLVDATGRDHPRRAGLALHLGAVIGIPTIGVTHRPLLATGVPPPFKRGATSPLQIGADIVAYWVCTRSGTRPVVAHAGWRTSPETAVAVVLACSGQGARTPTPLGEARRVARETRAVAEGRVQQPRAVAEGRVQQTRAVAEGRGQRPGKGEPDPRG
jgi:deoxyribonuclease V